MSATDALPRLVRLLGDACGFELKLVEGSIIVEGDYIVATARSPSRSLAARAVVLEAVAEILISPNDDGALETWALVFFFINGLRVAPPGENHLTLKLEQGDDGASRWVAKLWEADVYEEWTGLEHLDDE